MSKEKEELKKGKKFFLLVSIIVLSCSIIHGKESIVRDERVNGDIAGNEREVNGRKLFDQDPNNNKISILGIASVRGEVCGARNDTNPETDVTNNTVVVKTTSDITRSVYGGSSSGTGNATKNKVAIISGTIGRNVYGGGSREGEAAGNVIEITGGTIGLSVFGGWSSRTATNNKVVIRSGNITRNVYGGWSTYGEIRENVVEITGGTIGLSVFGGWSSRTATNNKVVIRSGNITRNVYGGWSTYGEIRENVVEITGGTIGLSVFGGRSSRNSTNNKVTISNVNITSNVYGGVSDNGEATGNVLEITGGTIGVSVFGGRSYGNATNNKVVIRSGNITRNVYGGWSAYGETRENVLEITGGAIGVSVFGGMSLGTASSNKVTISNVNITSNVYGGYSEEGEATGNEIEIEGSPTFSSTNTIICGGWSNSRKESKRGNVLNIRAKGIEVLGIKNFEAYKFYNPTKTPMVTVGNVVDLSEVKVSIEELDNVGEIEVGEMYVLIKSSSEIKGIDAVEILSTQEMLARYDYVPVVEDNELEVMVSNIEVNAKSKELTEARVGSMIFIGEGISSEIGKEILEEEGSRKVNRALVKYFKSLGISRKREKEILGEKGSRKVKPFVVVREGKSKYGNEIKEVGGVRVGGGIVKEIETFGKEILLGGYVEYGDGKYRSKEEIGGEVNSRGKSNYVGIGVKGEVEIKERIYGQIGMRIGRYENDFESDDMGIGSKEGEEMKYDIGGMYRGVEVGGRYKIVEEDNIGVEVNGEIRMMSMGGKEVKLTNGNKVDFKGVKIGKVRMEVRGEYAVKEKIKPYVGLGCEYEKMWDVEARSGNLEIPSSHIEGISGIGEMGVEGQIGKIGIKCGCECYVGERKGIDGMLKVRYAI